jgi:hypothetical protein
VKKPDRNLLVFKPVRAGRGPAAREALVQEWTATDHKFTFSITREFNAREQAPFFVAHAGRADGSKRRWRIGWKFETFEEAVRLCSVYTRTSRR